MKRIRHSPEQIIRKLREADAELAKGTAIPEVCKALGVAENTYYRWRNQFGGMKADEMKRLKDLERENARLKGTISRRIVHRGQFFPQFLRSQLEELPEAQLGQL